MPVNLSIKNSIISKFIVLAYVLTLIILSIISTLYINQYTQLKDSKIVAKTLQTVVINNNSLRALHVLKQEIINTPDEISSHNESLNNLRELILSNLRKMEIPESERSYTLLLNNTANYVANVKANKKNKELLIEELEEIHDQLRAVQENFILSNDAKIDSILKRDNSLTLGICLFAFICVLFIVYIVWKYIKRLKRSLDNLIIATREINKKNYSFQAPVIGETELAVVTVAFNKMTKLLGQHKSELLEIVEFKNKLLTFSNLFARALTEEEVYDVVFSHAFSFLGAGVGTAYILNKEADTLLLRKYSGFIKSYSKEWSEIKADSKLPIWDAIKQQKAIYLASSKSYYPNTDQDHQLYFTPIIIESRAIGVLTFSYPEKKILSENEKDFLKTLTTSCANALYRTKLYDNAKKAITVRDDFLSIASHELQTPLTPLKMQMQIYKSKILRNEQKNLTAEAMLLFLNNSIAQIDKISHLIDDLLNVSNINNGKLIINRTRFNLKSFLDKLLMTHSLYTKNSLAVNVVNEIADSFEVNWDGYKIEQIILNLLTNANKYATGHSVDLTITANEKIVCINLRDYGEGIRLEDREKVFKKYERLDNQTNIRGLGLGLYISKEIAHLHDGDLRIIDTDGVGATFSLNLPINNS